MSFTLFAGSFSRYFAGEWEFAAGEGLDHTRAAEPDDLDAHGATQPADPDDLDDVDPGDVQAFFEDLQQQIVQELSRQVRRQASGMQTLNWTEALDAPYIARGIASHDYSALIIFAARLVIKGRKWPPADLRKTWLDDPAICALQGADKDIEPIHHLVNADTWLPADFLPIARVEIPDGELTIGSLHQLTLMLQHLRDKLASASVDELGIAANDLAGARRALAIFTDAVSFATQHNLPMLLEEDQDEESM